MTETVPSALVHVRPLNATISVQRDETLFGAAIREGLRWPTACHGEGWCTLCHIEILEGGADLPLPSILEQQALDNLSDALRGGPMPVRLACQIRPQSEMTVQKRGVGVPRK